MSTYENAPATRMLATHCAACGRALVDAKSVEVGMGPDCREKHGYNIEVSEEAREQANKLVYLIASERSTGHITLSTLEAACALRLLGFSKLAGVIIERCADITITESEQPKAGWTQPVLVVHAPYSEEATQAWRNIPGRRWDKDAKANVVPASDIAKRQLWNLLKRYFAARIGIGPQGAFQVPA